MLLPAEFLSALEDTGLIIPVGKWVIQQACLQLHQWKLQGNTEWTLAVNLSPAQFEQHDIIDVVCNALAQYQLSPACLTLELTESTALKNLKRSVEVLNAFSALGITVSIDDFGTGYSNILMLKSLPARELKIDRIFVKDISENSKPASNASGSMKSSNSTLRAMDLGGVCSRNAMTFKSVPNKKAPHTISRNRMASPSPAPTQAMPTHAGRLTGARLSRSPHAIAKSNAMYDAARSSRDR